MLPADEEGGFSVGAVFHAVKTQTNRWLETYPVPTALCGTLFLAVWIICLIPSTVVELWLGYQFGLWLGFLLVYTGKVLGCMASFALGRTILQKTCTRCLEKHELFRAFNRAVSKEPITVCFLARAAYIPISLKNYGFAVRAAETCARVCAPPPRRRAFRPLLSGPSALPKGAAGVGLRLRERWRRCAQVLSVPTGVFALALVSVEVFTSFLLVFIGRWGDLSPQP